MTVQYTLKDLRYLLRRATDPEQIAAINREITKLQELLARSA